MKKFLNSFHKVEQAKEKISSLIIGEDNDISFTKIFKKELEFLPNYYLYEVTQSDMLPPKAYKAFISADRESVYKQDGSAEQFYAIAHLKDFCLSPSTVEEYIQCFFYCVYGGQGQLSLVETINDVNWRDKPAPALLSLITAELSPLSAQGEDENSYLYEGCFVSNNALVKAQIKVLKNGRVTVNELEILFENLPVKSNFID